MRWLNIEIANLRSPAYVGAEPVERATWLSLLSYCADQENGGVIKGCREWKDRQWQMTCGVLASEVSAQAQLWEWRGRDLRIAFYPVAKEAEVQAKREFASRGGRASGEARREAQLEAQLQPEGEAGGSQDGEADRERKGKERNVMEGKGKEVGRSAPQSNAYLLDEEFWAEMRRHYPGIDVDAESRKMDAWLLAHPGRKKTRQFVINWLNKVEPALAPAMVKEVDLTW
jgi:hypothetical protein